jgi:2-succinyl-6-hydroxy-2,4-cyclohexadiene-1-carboxylate synthase
MLIKYSDIKLNIEMHLNDSTSENAVFLLHGFTGCAQDWLPIVPFLSKEFNYYMVDIIGHGKSDSPVVSTYYYMDSLVNQLKEIINNLSIKKTVLAGYSMGGRIALSFALKHGSMLEGLVLESTTGGISEEQLREERVRHDENLAEYIENNPIETFIDYWMNIDLFNTQRRFSNEKLQEIRENKLANNKTGLANSLRYSGAGRMGPLYNKLKNITVDTLLITGELDSKFTDINEDMVRLFPSAKHFIIKHAGHNTHLEEPQRFTETVNNYLLAL